MQINSTNSYDPAPAVQADSARQSGRTGHHHRHHGGGDTIQLSGPALELPAGGGSGVARLQAAVDAGTYYVPPNEIARSVINSALSGT